MYPLTNQIISGYNHNLSIIIHYNFFCNNMAFNSSTSSSYSS